MHELEPARIAHRLAELRSEHRDLDSVISRLQADILMDELAIKRLKKRKLMLKDQIQRISDEITPDIIA